MTISQTVHNAIFDPDSPTAFQPPDYLKDPPRYDDVFPQSSSSPPQPSTSNFRAAFLPWSSARGNFGSDAFTSSFPSVPEPSLQSYQAGASQGGGSWITLRLPPIRTLGMLGGIVGRPSSRGRSSTSGSTNGSRDGSGDGSKSGSSTRGRNGSQMGSRSGSRNGSRSGSFVGSWMGSIMGSRRGENRDSGQSDRSREGSVGSNESVVTHIA